ncbi:E3 ubiquitin-protein ligase SH3RF1 isoform X1 [Vanessa atalanta]|uniref:E3 ubiquitin-protein ligase SH3RF1 isoform X1 n=1 Tax=Vanessa atalanta TaxID=42275 RepID=UPI001FCD226B|nr:E3 ubiquitin-protein ligase SH3RF1 isoform X1 [Vanessa atalanta]
MDEGLLNDLLECSVCLERLDTSSRVLPCQHTFCLKCLKVIVESHKELRCPECRILVETKVEELPPNVLLMRILEGMKNSAPRKIIGQRVRSGHSQTQSQVQPSRADGKQPPPHARAMYDFISNELGDLSFKKGETIILHKKLDPFWYHGECSGRSGMFPITYVQVVVPLPVPTALCKALYDFRMSAPDEEGCLAFDKGAIITVHRRVDENWAEGRLDQRVGIFPIAFVELNQAARHLMNSAPLNRPVPPVPEHARAGHSEHRQQTQHPHRYQPMSVSSPNSGQGQGNYQNLATMSQSHPNYHATHAQILVPQPVSHHVTTVAHGGLVTTTAVPRNMDLIEKKNTKDFIKRFINLNNKITVTVGNDYDEIRQFLHASKPANLNSTPVHRADATYQNVRTHEHFPVQPTFASNNSSDSSSSVNTPSTGVVGGSSTTTPNTSSNTSTCESAEPSLPSSPDNNTDRNSTVPPSNNAQNPSENENQETQESLLNASLGVLSLNESSTATNTSLNVSLPPSESPKLNASVASNASQNNIESQESASNNEFSRLEAPSSSKNVMRSSGPDSLLNFGLGLQAALSPSHNKEGNYMMTRGHRDQHHREREKRHSLTPSSHLQGNNTQNRHSAEILATSLLDHAMDRDRERPEREKERRRRRSRSNERPLPAAYIALYPYKPQKSDELELKKGGVYTVTERCRDGWYKGCCERAARGGVFPGNYVAPLAPLAPPPARARLDKNVSNALVNVKPATGTTSNTSNTSNTLAPPDAPPRASSPITSVQPLTYPWSSVQPQQSTPRSEKSKEKSKSEKGSISTGVSLMKRLAAMKKCKSPPPAGYSMDNPVFEDGPGTSLMLPAHAHPHPVHVRSGSCPSQLLRAPPAAPPAARAAPAPRDQRAHRGPGAAEWATHRKSASLDVSARRERHAPPLKERFRCIVPYPPNSEYELELRVDDIVVVCKKRGDGWYKGTLQRTGRTGLFPASFVQSCPPD